MDSPNAEPIWRPEVVPGERIFLSHGAAARMFPQYARWFSDLELTTYLGSVGQSFTIEQEHDWYERTTHGGPDKTFAIVVREGQRLIGSVSLMNIVHQRGVCELGIAIGDKQAWGKGYGSEATRLICDYGFTFLNLQTIYLWHVAFNERAHRAYLKAGFQLAGRIRGGEEFAGQRYDKILMDITREDFGQSAFDRDDSADRRDVKPASNKRNALISRPVKPGSKIIYLGVFSPYERYCIRSYRSAKGNA